MATRLVRATQEDAGDYVRIGKLTTSRLNQVTTDPKKAAQEIAESFTYMIEVQGRRVGFISYTVPEPDHAYIAEVQVDPASQSQGLGGFALQAVLADIDELLAVDLVDLHTHPENPAQRLYERHGFRATGEWIENYHQTGEPRIRMVRTR